MGSGLGVGGSRTRGGKKKQVAGNPGGGLVHTVGSGEDCGEMETT